MSGLRFALTSADPVRLAQFYRDALGFEASAPERVSAASYGVDGQATLVRLRLGAQSLDLLGFDQPGQAYPAGSTSHDSWFQHLALVAADIDAAYARLAGCPGWTPISTAAGPVQLPESSGGVRAFKFRDPEGHPLELLAFPPGKAPPAWAGVGDGAPLIGIDHSAIVVADVDRSVAFYRTLGFALSDRSENTGPGQDALDGAEGVRVSVRALSLDSGTPHLELLGYHAPAVHTGDVGITDIARTRTILPGTAPSPTVDPDGHLLIG